jgi:membrane-associated phospholipid phosphatase
MNKARTVAALIVALAFECNAFAQDRLADFTKQFLQQERGLWTSPLHVDRQDIKWLLPLGISAGALLRTDRNISDEVGEVATLRRSSRVISRAGSAVPILVAPLAIMAIGHVSKNETASKAGRVGLEAVLHSVVMVQTLKTLTNRERPNKLAGDGGFWDGGKSFPSGHAMTSWALAAAIADQYPDKKWIGITGYSMATAISVSRVGGLNHFPSDVLIGSSLGWLIGHYVSHHAVNKRTPQKN